MIGNDIIDLHLSGIESDWQRKGWLQKIFSEEEQLIISFATNKELMIWLLWSMKESAYKIIHRMYQKMFYTPAKLQCTLNLLNDQSALGIVRFQGNTFYTRTTISGKFLHTIATLENNFTDITVYIWNECKSSPLQHSGYRFFKDKFGIPYLSDSSGKIKAVSKSHHGRYEAIAF